MTTRTHTVDGNNDACFEEIRIAISSIRVRSANILTNLDGTPNRKPDRKKELNHLLNAVFKAGCDLLVLPEVSIPHCWLGELGKWCREHDIGIVAGLEHQVDEEVAFNRVATILPLVRDSGHRDCYSWLRLKRHYAPSEVIEITGRHLNVPSGPKQPYDLFSWRGSKFAVYNCYELTSIEERALFKAKVDFIVCSEFNRDTHYFSNIVESAARDLHCYVIQVNDSYHGDSRIVSPSKREQMDIVRFKGGENTTFLRATLRLQALRKFQSFGHSLQQRQHYASPDDGFKVTPPVWDIKAVRKRMRRPRGRKK